MLLLEICIILETFVIVAEQFIVRQDYLNQKHQSQLF